MPYGLKITSWDGHTEINDEVSYSADFLIEDGLGLETFKGQTVESQLPGQFPVPAFVQPDGLRFAIEITILGELTQTKLDTLKGWFNPGVKRQRWLVAEDEYGEGDAFRLACYVEGLVISQGVNVLKAALRASQGLWEDETETEEEDEITASGQTIEVTNPGNADAPIVVTLSASEVSDTNQTTLRRTFVANRSEQAVFDYAAEAYPIDIANEGDFGSPGDDLRVYLNSELTPHWIDGSKVFVNLHLRPRLSATLENDISSGDEDLSVDNIEGLDGWPERGWFFIDDEVFQYEDRARLSPGTLTRRWPTSHSAGASLYWIEHELAVVTDNASPETPPEWEDSRPIIDLSASGNTVHKWVNKFFPLRTRRSRGWLRELTDDNTGHVRTHDEDDTLIMEDRPPAAEKPPLSHLAMRFPVPLVGPLTLDYSIDPSMHLLCRVTDLDGFESNLFSKFWTQTPVIGASFPSIPLQKVELIGRIAAVTGEVDASEVVSVSLTPFNQSLTLENPLYDQVKNDWASYLDAIAQEYAIWQETIRAANGGAGGTSSMTAGSGIPGGITKFLSVNIPLRGYIHLNFDKETKINGILIYLYGTSEAAWSVYNADNGGPFKPILEMTFPAGSAGQRVAFFDPPAVLPAGEYFLRPTSGGYAIGMRPGRTKASIWYGFHDVPRERDQTQSFSYNQTTSSYFQYNGSSDVNAHTKTIVFEVNETADVDVPAKDWMHQDHFDYTPIVAVLSEETEPQSDAPIESGGQVVVDNIIAPLDDSRSPKVWAAPEEDLDFIQGRLTNENTGRSVDIVHFMPLGEQLELDIETEEVIDGETQLQALYAVGFSHPDEGLVAVPGTNTFSWTEPGVASRTVNITLRGRHL